MASNETVGSEFDLSGRVAIVTGAGRGMGCHIALALARYGADMVICSRTVSELEKLGKEIQDLGRRVFIKEMDIKKVPDIDAMVNDAVDFYGHIDILINNAGVNRPQWAEDVTDQEIIDGMKLLAETEGIFTETAGGVTTAVTKKLIEQGRIPRDHVLCHMDRQRRAR